MRPMMLNTATARPKTVFRLFSSIAGHRRPRIAYRGCSPSKRVRLCGPNGRETPGNILQNAVNDLSIEADMSDCTHFIHEYTLTALHSDLLPFSPVF